MNLVYTFIFWYGLYNDVMAEINAVGLLVVFVGNQDGDRQNESGENCWTVIDNDAISTATPYFDQAWLWYDRAYCRHCPTLAATKIWYDGHLNWKWKQLLNWMCQWDDSIGYPMHICGHAMLVCDTADLAWRNAGLIRKLKMAATKPEMQITLER